MNRECREKPCKGRSRESGFTLIDISIGLIIVGILIVPLIWQYNIEQRKELTQGNINVVTNVQRAMVAFLELNGRYPCPANPSLTTADAGHGMEVCGGLPAAGNCTGAGNTGICVYAGNKDVDPTPGNDLIVQGSIPYVTMGLIPDKTTDPFFRKLTYAVSFNVMSGVPVVHPDLHPATGLPYRNYEYSDLGVITVDRYNLELDTIDLDPTSVFTDKRYENVEAVLVAHGYNGAGAYRVSDGGRLACAAGSLDTENCDLDFHFVSRQHKLVTGANYYDDYVENRFSIDVGVWNMDKGTRNYFVSKDDAQVGIGTQNPNEKLEVVGNMRVDKVRNLEICDETGADCFDPDKIGGNGMTCPPGFIMNGTTVVAGVVQATCTKPNFPISAADISCPANQYVYAITHDGMGGVNLQCSGL